MYTPISATNPHAKVFMQKNLMLNGYAAIQYCTGIQSGGSSYTQDCQLLFVKNGILRLRFGNQDFEVGANQVVLLKKNILVEFQKGSTVPGDCGKPEFIQFIIKQELVREFTKLASLPGISRDEIVPLIVRECKSECLAYMSSLEALLLGTEKQADGLVKIKMLELFFHLSGTDKALFEQLLDLREHYRTDITLTVEENIMNSISVEQMAVLSGRSLSSFRRDFVAIYNMPPSQWIRMKRLEKAKELLLGTTMTITDICYTLGFENLAHFSRLFKAHCGYPPTGYKTNSTAA